MRLTDFQIEAIVSSTRKIFSDKALVYLFGSRVDDELKGGDIDLMISDEDDHLTLQKKIIFLVDLKRKIGDQKIDLVFDNANTRSKQSFYQSILNHCICLNKKPVISA